MYITVFDLLTERFDPLRSLPRWRDIQAHNKAMVSGLVIVVVLILLCGTAVLTSYHYPPLIILGVFCGGVVAKLLGQFLAPKIQSHLTAFLGGITAGNIGSSATGLAKLISGAAVQIDKLTQLLPRSVGGLSGPVTLSIWILLLTALVILAANAYYANDDKSRVGEAVAAPAAAAPAVAPPAAPVPPAAPGGAPPGP